MEERVQKIIAAAGICSRREAEELIREGAVTINGAQATLGSKAVAGKDAIKVRGKLISSSAEKPVYYLFFKPKDTHCTFEERVDEATLKPFFRKVKTRLFPVGKLDYHCDGLVILTNDGALAKKLQDSEKMDFVYEVKVKGHPAAEAIEKLGRGGRVEDRLVEIKWVKPRRKLHQKTVLAVCTHEGSLHTLKKYFNNRGFLWEKITRVRIGSISVRGLRPGQFAPLSPEDVRELG